MATINLDVDDELYEKAKAAAAKLGIPFSGLIRLLLQSHLQEIQFGPRKEPNHSQPVTQ